jgi:hypothetical protein
MAGSAEAWASASLVDLPCDSSTFAARDARDRFLPSSHSGASTRASLALDEVAPRRQASFSSPTCCPACLGPSYRAAPRFTTRERAETDGTGLVRGVFLPRAACSTESLAPLSIRSDQAASLVDMRLVRPRILDRFSGIPVKVSRFHDPRRLPSKRAFSRPRTEIRRRAREATLRSPLERAGSAPWFCRHDHVSPCPFGRAARAACWAERATST